MPTIKQTYENGEANMPLDNDLRVRVFKSLDDLFGHFVGYEGHPRAIVETRQIFPIPNGLRPRFWIPFGIFGWVQLTKWCVIYKVGYWRDLPGETNVENS